LCFSKSHIQPNFLPKNVLSAKICQGNFYSLLWIKSNSVTSSPLWPLPATRGYSHGQLSLLLPYIIISHDNVLFSCLSLYILRA
jgi:hypothetical protein